MLRLLDHLKNLKTQGIEEHKKLLASVTKEKELKTRIKELIRLTLELSMTQGQISVLIDKVSEERNPPAE